MRTSDGLPTDYGFTGQKLDASSSLMYYGARYYAADLGRFVQPDSIIPEPFNPQSLNRYSYVVNNPVRYTDPSGHQSPDDLWALLQRLWRMLTDPGYRRSQACGRNVDPNCGRTNVSPSVSGLLDSGEKYAQEKLNPNFGPPITNPETLKAIKLAAELGQWLPKNESMPPAAREYQEYVTGRSGEVFIYNDADFDGFNGKALLEAKDHYSQFIDPNTGGWAWWFDNTGAQDMVNKARRQVKAAQGAPIEWHFSEQAPMDLVKKMFEHEGIELIYDPLPPDWYE